MTPFPLNHINRQNSSENAAFGACGLAQSPSVRAGPREKQASGLTFVDLCLTARHHKSPKLKRERRFWCVRAHAKSVCASRLTRKASFSLEFCKFIHAGEHESPKLKRGGRFSYVRARAKSICASRPTRKTIVSFEFRIFWSQKAFCKIPVKNGTKIGSYIRAGSRE